MILDDLLHFFERHKVSPQDAVDKMCVVIVRLFYTSGSTRDEMLGYLINQLNREYSIYHETSGNTNDRQADNQILQDAARVHSSQK